MHVHERTGGRAHRRWCSLWLGVTLLVGLTAPDARAQPCDHACAKAYLQGLQALREREPTGTQIYDQLRLKPTKAAERARPEPAPKPRPTLTFAQMLANAPKRPVKLRLPTAPATAAARRAPVGDAGGPSDQAACDDEKDAEACNRCGRRYWDRLSGGRANDANQVPTLRAAARWYGKACDLDKETACWEGIGLLQRIQRVRPLLR